MLLFWAALMKLAVTLPINFLQRADGAHGGDRHPGQPG
jgi:hypothetical protein